MNPFENPKLNRGYVKYKHGMYKTPIWVLRYSIVTRSRKRGKTRIALTDKRKDFNQFYKDVGDKPENKLLGRLDYTKEYCKENCKRMTKKEWGSLKSSNLK